MHSPRGAESGRKAVAEHGVGGARMMKWDVGILGRAGGGGEHGIEDQTLA